VNQTIGFIGGGNMASGLINGGVVKASEIMVFDPSSERSAELQTQFSINVAANNEELIQNSSVVVIAYLL